MRIDYTEAETKILIELLLAVEAHARSVPQVVRPLAVKLQAGAPRFSEEELDDLESFLLLYSAEMTRQLGREVDSDVANELRRKVNVINRIRSKVSEACTTRSELMAQDPRRR